MAQKRMFSLQVVDTDQFLDLPASAQALYFHLGMHGDDDGFVSSPRKIQRSVGCGEDDLRLLAQKGFLILFPSGVVVIRDWKANNTLRNDRYIPTVYQDEMAALRLERNGRYTLVDSVEPAPEPSDAKTETACDTMEEPCLVPSGSVDAPDRGSFGSTVEPQPNVTQPNVTQPNVTQPNVTQPNVTQPNGTKPNKTKPNQMVPADKPPVCGGFEKFWSAYPKKVGKKSARKAFSRVKEPVETLLTAIARQKCSAQWSRENGLYIPNPATWLNQGRWEDELPGAEDFSCRPESLMLVDDGEGGKLWKTID